MAFGLSFGSNKSKGSSVTDVNKTETTDQTQTGTTATTGSQSTTGSSSTQSTQTGTQSGSSTQATTGSQNTTQASTQFSEPVLGGLESTVQALLGNLPSSPQQLGGSFNHDQFVSGGVNAAQSQIQGDLEASLNSIFDTVGGRDDSNSMATLLANRARGDAAAQVQGVRSQLEGQAQGIEKDRFLANLQGVGQQQGFLAQVLDALKGGRAQSTGATTTAENTTGTNQQSNTVTGSENTQTAQDTLTNTLQQLLQTLQGTTNTTGTESTKTKGTQTGGGFGLSI
jgi:hypothetical protein